MLRVCDGGEARARRRTRDVMNDVDPLDVARLRTRDNPLRMKRARRTTTTKLGFPASARLQVRPRVEKSPDDMSVAMAALRATLVAAFVAFASGSCLEPAVELFVGVGCDPSGFYVEALGLHAALRAAGVCVRTPLLSRCEPDMRASLTAAESAMSRDAGAFQDGRATPQVEVRWHNGETAACPWTPAAVRAAERAGTVAILRSMAEKTKLSKVLLECCALVHETWVPTEWHRSLYRRAGCENARTLPETVDAAIFRPRASPGAETGTNERMPTSPSTTVFLSVFQWQARKAPDALLEAYWTAFGPEDDVVLRVKSNVPRWAGQPFQNAREGVAHYAKKLRGVPCSALARVETLEDRETTREEMAQMYRSAHAFVLPSRGEGWCLPCAEAMSSDVLLIASDFSGVTAFANAENSLPVRCPVISSGKDAGYCEPDAEGLAWRMRWTHEHREEAAAMGRRGGEDMRERFGMRAVGERWREESARAVRKISGRTRKGLVDVD